MITLFMSALRRRVHTSLRLIACAGFVAFGAASSADAKAAELPLKGGERILFIGNSLTGDIPEELNQIFAANGLPTFEGYRVQIWNQSLETHATLSRETHAKLFHATVPDHAKGYAVKGASTLWKKGLYDKPEFTERGYILAAEAIKLGTPAGQPWDFVVLQEYNSDKADNKIAPDGTLSGSAFTHIARFAALAREAGATPLLYTRWLGNPESGGWAKNRPKWRSTFETLLANEDAIAQHLKLEVIPVGHAALTVLESGKPEPALADGWLMSDNVHASAFGSGLTLYAFASQLSRRAPAQITIKVGDYAVGMTDKNHGPVTPERDQALRDAVWKILQAREAWAR
jgi:hypothetical protein